jgi:hypothetical protein
MHDVPAEGVVQLFNTLLAASHREEVPDRPINEPLKAGL